MKNLQDSVGGLDLLTVLRLLKASRIFNLFFDWSNLKAEEHFNTGDDLKNITKNESLGIFFIKIMERISFRFFLVQNYDFGLLSFH